MVSPDFTRRLLSYAGRPGSSSESSTGPASTVARPVTGRPPTVTLALAGNVRGTRIVAVMAVAAGAVVAGVTDGDAGFASLWDADAGAPDGVGSTGAGSTAGPPGVATASLPGFPASAVDPPRVIA